MLSCLVSSWWMTMNKEKGDLECIDRKCGEKKPKTYT